MSAEFTVAAWHKGEACVEALFGGSRAAFTWAVEDNPAGTRLTHARRAGRTIAALASVPVRTRVVGETKIFAQRWSGWCAPGEEEALRAVERALYEVHGGPDGDLVHYAWPREPEIPGLKADGDYELLRVGTLFGRACEGGPRTLPSGVHRVERFGPEADVLYACCATHWNASAIRDAAFLNWRFARHPCNAYQSLVFQTGDTLRGYAIVRAGEEFGPRLGLLLDWLVLPGDEEASETLLAAALAVARAEGAAGLVTAVPEWSPWAQVFQSRGFEHHATEHLAFVRSSVPRFDMLWLRDNWWGTLADALLL